MVKNTVVALIAAASLAGIAVPAFAAQAPEPAPEPVAEVANQFDSAFGGGSVEMRSFIADSVLAQLRQNGVNATSVEDWSGLIRAYVTLDNGTQVMQFFRPGSLEQVLL